MPKTLKARFIVAFITIEILFLILIVGLNFSTLNKASNQLIDEEIETSSKLFTELIKTPLAIYDLATIDDAVLNFSRINNIDAIRIVDAKNQLIANFQDDTRLSQKELEGIIQGQNLSLNNRNDYKYKIKPIVYQGSELGKLLVVFETSDTNNIIKKNKIFTIILIVLFILISYFTADYIGNKIGGSLNTLIKIARSVADNKVVEIISDKNESQEIKTLFTSMKQMQESIQNRNQEIQETVNTLQQFVRAIDESAIVSKTTPDGIITFANRLFCEVSGFTLKEILGKTHSILRHPDNEDDFYKKLWETLTSKKTYHGIIKNRNKNGEEFYVDTSIVPLLDINNEIVEYIDISYDITSVVQAKDKAIAAEISKDAFLSNMSHEIRTPLNAILGFVRILQREVVEEKAKSYLNVIEGSSESLLHIINDILDFSKIQSGKFQIEKFPFNPLIETASALRLFSATAQEKMITFIAKIDPNMPLCIENDLIRIKQIMFNFLSNAFKFTPAHGIIRVSITFDHKQQVLHISVEDSGIGIDKVNQAKIFSAFEQADTSTTREFGGTGLGLSITSELARLMDGKVSVESSIGKGSTFSLRVPSKICEGSKEIKSILKKEKIGIFKTQRKLPLIEAFIYYLEALKIPYSSTETSVKGSACDCFVFIPNGTIEDEVLSSKKSAIAMVGFESQEFKDQDKFLTLESPFTSVDILDRLKIDAPMPHSISKVNRIVKKVYNARVLIAEDNRTNQMLLGLLLDEYKLSYIMANDGNEAVESFKSRPFDLVLMDINMPRKNGIEAFNEIRAYEKAHSLREVPIIALTANALVHDREHFFASGMNDFLAKPIDVKELERVLEAFLS